MSQKSRVDGAIIRYRHRVRITRTMILVTLLAEAALGIRFVMKLIAADPQSYAARFRYNLDPMVTQAIYAFTDPLLYPFAALKTQASAEGSVLELPTLVAMLAYALLSWAIGRIILMILQKRRLDRIGRR